MFLEDSNGKSKPVTFLIVSRLIFQKVLTNRKIDVVALLVRPN